MASTTRRSAVERPASHSRRDAVVQQFLSLADALARRFQQRFTALIELDDARQAARYELNLAAACLKPGYCTTAAFLKQRIHEALQHYLLDHGSLVRVSRCWQEKGIHPWSHQSLDALGGDERPFLDNLASPVREAAHLRKPRGFRRSVAAEASGQRGRDPAPAGAGEPDAAEHRRRAGGQRDDRQPPRESCPGGATGAKLA